MHSRPASLRRLSGTFGSSDERSSPEHLVHAVRVSLESQVAEIVRALVAEDPSVRARSADEVTDIVRDYSPGDAAALAYLLVALRISEADNVAQESQLNALAELAAWHDMPTGALALLAHVPQETITGSQVQHMGNLSR